MTHILKQKNTCFNIDNNNNNEITQNKQTPETKTDT